MTFNNVAIVKDTGLESSRALPYLDHRGGEGLVALGNKEEILHLNNWRGNAEYPQVIFISQKTKEI